jgi:hypothetical protein
MSKDLPYQIPRVNVKTFNNASKAKVLDACRSRRVFGVVNTSNSDILGMYLQPNGAGDPINLTHEKNANKHDGGSFELNGYNGEFWAIGEGYVYYFES